MFFVIFKTESASAVSDTPIKPSKPSRQLKLSPAYKHINKISVCLHQFHSNDAVTSLKMAELVQKFQIRCSLS